MSEVAARNEPEITTGVTRDEIPAVLCVPPQPQGMDPQKDGGFGPNRDAETVWAAIGMTPLQTWLAVLNDWLRQEAIRFASFELAPAMARKT